MRPSSTARSLLLLTVITPAWLIATTAAGQGIRGDFNGDGFDDLAIGVPGEDRGRTNEGAVNVLYGSAAGVKAMGNQLFALGRMGVPGRSQKDSGFGTGMAVGDFDGDGFDDLAIGAPGFDTDGKGQAGMVVVLPGSAAGLTTTGVQEWSQDGLRGKFERGDNFGDALTSGDFNGDGFADLAVGAPTENLRDIRGVGAVNVIFGSATGLDALDNQFWHQDSPGIKDRIGEFERFGSTLVAADFNGDGFDELVIGVPKEDVVTRRSAGAFHVLLGSASGPTHIDDLFFDQASPGVNGRPEGRDEFGASMACGDFDGDGFTDLAVSARGDTVDMFLAAGAVHVFFGGASGLTAGGSQYITQSDRGIPGDAGEFHFFGSSVSAADFDGDGRDDLAVGVRGETVGGAIGAGVAIVLPGGHGGLNRRASTRFSQNGSGVPDRASPLEGFGTFSTVGDYNGDGFADLAIGVPNESVGSTRGAGVLHIFYGSAGGLGSTGTQLWSQNSGGVRETSNKNDAFGRFGRR